MSLTEIGEMTFKEDISRLTESQFRTILKSGKRNNSIMGVEFESVNNLSYGFVKVEIQNQIKSLNFVELVRLALEEMKVIKTNEEIEKWDHNEILSFVLFLNDELERIAEIEVNELSTDPEPEMIQAGVHELNQFGELNTIDALAEGNILNYDLVLKQPYILVFSKLKKTKIENQIGKRLQEIHANKAKLKR